MRKLATHGQRDERRDQHVAARFTASERRLIDDACVAEELSLSDFVRGAVMGRVNDIAAGALRRSVRKQAA